MQQVDTLIHARWIIPVEPDDRVLEHHSLVVHEGRVLDILPTTDCRTQYNSTTTLELGEHALIPGLINAHTHAAMTLMRGLADDLPLHEWLNDHIWPAEGKWVSQEFVKDGTELAIAEMIRSGTTCFADMYFFPDETAHVVEKSGIRACVGLIMIDFPTAWANNAEEYLSKGLELHDHLRGNPLVHTAFAPHAPYTVSDQPLENIATLAEELDIPIHIHIHETADEISMALEKNGNRPIARLQQLGLLTSRLMAVHMTQLSDDEITQVAEAGSNVIHCPESNLKLASGYCPVQKLLDANVNVALGTDGTASNNDLDMFGEMRTAALVAKTVANDASAGNAYQILRMATINGAKALGIEEETGSLSKGKSADITAVRLDNLETQPMYHPISQLVYAAGREHVTDVWVAGKHLLKDRALTTLDGRAILAKAREWGEKIKINA